MCRIQLPVIQRSQASFMVGSSAQVQRAPPLEGPPAVTLLKFFLNSLAFLFCTDPANKDLVLQSRAWKGKSRA